MGSAAGQRSSSQPAPSEPHLFGSQEWGVVASSVSDVPGTGQLSCARLSPAFRQALNAASSSLCWPVAAARSPAFWPHGSSWPMQTVVWGSKWNHPRLRVILTFSFPSLPRVLPGAGRKKKRRRKPPPETNHLYILWKENIFVNSYSFIIMRVRSRLIKRFLMEALPPPKVPSKPWGW